MPDKNMNKNLDNLSTEELGKLFPVVITESNSEWKKWFEIEKSELEKILGKEIALRIEHFGSTAIPDLKSKPTIDILVEIPETEITKSKIIQKMKSEGYRFIPRNDCLPPYIMFVKGYTDEGIKVKSYHIHMAPKNHRGLWDRLYFRDYLISNPETKKEYEKLKIKLAARYKHDREAYTEEKTEFVKRITERAKRKNNKRITRH